MNFSDLKNSDDSTIFNKFQFNRFQFNKYAKLNMQISVFIKVLIF